MRSLIIELEDKVCDQILAGEVKLPGTVVGAVHPLRECKNDRCNVIFEPNGKRKYCTTECGNRQAYRNWEKRQKAKETRKAKLEKTA